MLKKIIAIILTIGLFFCGIVHTEFVYAATVDANENMQSMPENKTNIEAENSFGGLLTNALESEMDTQEGNNGYQIFSVEIEGTSAYVSFESVTSATLVVGIYEEAGIKLLNFGSLEVTPDDSEAFINLEKEELPQYFYVRIFFVDTTTLRPLCDAYETPDYTKEMQDLFQSTTEDYEADRVLNLDDDITNNFAVYEDTTKIILDDGENNQLIMVNDVTQSYVFEHANEEITSLTTGDIFAYRSNGEDLIIKVGAIHIDGTTVTIQGTETSMDEAFAYVKINAQQTTSELDMSQATCGEGVTYLGKIDEDEKNSDMDNSSRKIEIGESLKLENKYELNIKDKTGTVNLSGTAKAGMGISVMAYITLHHQKIDFTVNESLNMNITAKVNLKEEVNLFTVPFSPIPAIHISVSLIIPIEVNAKISVTVDITAQQGFSYDTDTGFQSLTKSPDIDASVEIEGKLYVGLRLNITGDVLDEELLSLSLYGEVGEEFSASNVKKEDSDSVRHDCLMCLDGDITLKAGLYAKLNIVKIIDNKVFKLMENTWKQGDFYYCMDKNEFGWGNCPYRRFKITFTVRDWSMPFSEEAGLEGAQVNKENITDKTGNTVFYLPSGYYKYLIELNGYQSEIREFRVEDKPKKQGVLLKKVGGYEKPDDFTLEKNFKEVVGSENILYFKADDYDNNGAREAFGITGNCDQYGNLKIYFINQYAQVSCIDEIGELWVDETEFEDRPWFLLDTGSIKFFRLVPVNEGPTFLYGVKGNFCYQPEVSGKHAAFYRNENGTYNGDRHEGSGYRYIYEYNPDTGEFDYIDREWVGARILQDSFENIKASSPEYMMENRSVAVPVITENLNDTVKTASFTNLLPNETYNFYVMLSSENDNKFSKDNLLYIQQMESDREGSLNIEYSSEYIPDEAEVFLVAKTQTDISDAQVTMPKLTYNGKEQYVQPIITLGNKRLIEGTDYEISGAYSAVEVGHYKVAISGIGLYTGVLDAEYQIEDAPIVSSYTVTYNANGGTGAPATQEKTQGTVLTLSTVKPTWDGYTFLGWATSKTAAASEYVAGASFDKDQNTTLYAVWKANTYIITFNKNSGSGSLSKVSCTYGKSVALPANKFTRSGYKFLGWNTEKDGSGTGYANKASVKNLTSTNGKTVTLYAQWGKGVTVKYNANSGKVSKKSKKVYNKSTYGTLATPTRKGYAFTGWYTKKSGGSKITSKTKVSKKLNHTLYAHWTKTKNKIIYYLNGGKNNAKNPSGYYETTATITLKNPTKTGYTFEGWYSDSKFKKKVTKIKKGSAGVRKLYAKWAANTYTVRYNSNGGTGSMADTTSMKYGTSYKLRINTFKRSGYVFAGWAAAPDGKVVYTDGASVINLASDNGAVKTLYAKWTLIAVEKITLNATSVSINVGETYKLQAAISPAEATDNLVWSSGNTAVATVSNGVVTGETAGMTTITVKSSNGKTASCTVTVNTPEVLPSSITISEKTVTIEVGKTVSLTATVSPSNATNKSVTWTSSDTGVATVNDGTVTGKSAGTATITAATGNGKTASCTVTVNTPEVLPSSITLSEKTATIEVGKTVTLTVTVAPSNATNKSVTWTSSNTSVATVSDGTVTGESVGTAIITAVTSNGKMASCTVTVTNSVITAESVSLNKYSLNLEKGETEQLQATIKPSNVTDNSVVWSSADVSVATVDQNGTVKAVNDGKVTITVSTANGKKSTCSVTVYTSAQIRTVAELKAIENDLDGNYKLAANIDLGKIEWTPIGKDKNTPFTGILNGNGYQITGLSITDNSQVYSGLFGCCKGTVTNLTVSGTISTDGSNGDSYRYVGGIAGFAENAAIETCTNLVEINVSNENETIGTYTYAGGIVGAADSSTNIFECKNEADITAVSPKGTRADAMAGGIVGAAFNGGKIQDCENTGIISSDASNGTKYWVSSCAGGIAGTAGLSTITGCINRGNVFAEGFIAISSDYDSMVLAGGIAGHSDKSGNVSGENFADKIQATGNELIAIIQQAPLVAFSID